MGNFLDSAKLDKDSHAIKTSTGLHAAATGMQGWRLEMEVRIIILRIYFISLNCVLLLLFKNIDLFFILFLFYFN